MSKFGLLIPLLASSKPQVGKQTTGVRLETGRSAGIQKPEPGKLGRDRFLDGEEIRKDEVETEKSRNRRQVYVGKVWSRDLRDHSDLINSPESHKKPQLAIFISKQARTLPVSSALCPPPPFLSYLSQ